MPTSSFIIARHPLQEAVSFLMEFRNGGAVLPPSHSAHLILRLSSQGANVFGGKNDKANNNLSLTFVEALRIFQRDVEREAS